MLCCLIREGRRRRREMHQLEKNNKLPPQAMVMNSESLVERWMKCICNSSVFKGIKRSISSVTTEYRKLCLPHSAQCIWYRLNSFQNRKRGNCIITRSSVVVAMETSVGGVLCAVLLPSSSSLVSALLHPQDPCNFHPFFFLQSFSLFVFEHVRFVCY